jgi:tetratricopeptide (TPR) repeat protein
VRGRDGEARRLREEAAGLLRRALAADPERSEAALRLGSILLAQDRPHEAEAFLERAVAQARDDPQRYLALLFLGRAAELLEKPNDSVQFYRRALEAHPDAQAARLGLARCQEASDGPAAARPLVAAVLDAKAPQAVPDPWWSYPFGPRGLAQSALERLWQSALGRSFGS